MKALHGALVLGMVVGCANEKKDVKKLCMLIDESVTQNLGDKDVDAKLKDAGLKSEAAKSIRDGIVAEDVDTKLGALKKLSDKAKEHKLETECTAAIQVAELADAFMAALKDAAKDPKKAKEQAKTAKKKAKGLLGKAAAKEEEKAGVKEEEEAATEVKVEAGGTTATVATTTATGTTVTAETGDKSVTVTTTPGGTTTVTGTTGGTTGAVTTKTGGLGGIGKAIRTAAKRKAAKAKKE